MTTEQIVILAFLAAAFAAGWAFRALIGGGSRSAAPSPPAFEPEDRGPPSPEERFEGAVRDSRHELARANRAYHAAVVGSLRNGDGRPGEATLEVLSSALVSLAGAVDHASQELESRDPLTVELRGAGLELRRLANDVSRHARERELPAGVLDRLEQNLISAASMILASGRPSARAA